MENALMSTRNANFDASKQSPEKKRTQHNPIPSFITFNTTNPEEKDKGSEGNQEKGARIIEWLVSKGVRRGDPQ